MLSLIAQQLIKNAAYRSASFLMMDVRIIMTDVHASMTSVMTLLTVLVTLIVTLAQIMDEERNGSAQLRHCVLLV